MTASIEEKIELAQQKEQLARARTVRLRRALDQSNRRTLMQVKCTLGAAVLALAESGRGEHLVLGLRRWLDHYLTRSADRSVLQGTAFAIEMPEADGAQ